MKKHAREGFTHPSFLLALFLALMLAISEAVEYGGACGKATDCESKDAPFCSIFFTDKSYAFNDMDRYKTYTADEYKTALGKVNTVSKSKGMCVECVTDCDCGVNEFCGYDFEDEYDKNTKEWTYTYKVTIPSGNMSTNVDGGMPASVQKELELYTKQYQGLPIKSKCKKYSTSHMKNKPKVCDANIDMSAFGKMVEQSLLSEDTKDNWLNTCEFKDDKGDKLERVKRTPQTWPKDAQERFCGRIVSWGPSFYETRFIGEVEDTLMIKNSEFQVSSSISTGDSYDDMARCVPNVVAKDPVTCPSCLHSVDCFTHREDNRVCCTNTEVNNHESINFKAGRTCHDSTADEVSYTPYTTCESACARTSSQTRYYPDCKTPADGQKTAVMTVATPADNAEANKKTWCECVETCLTCTGAAGGVGERPTALTEVKTVYADIHGTCAPPPLVWETTSSTQPSATPAPSSVVTDTDFICAAATGTAEACAAASAMYTACRPVCVDCLVAAMQYKCAGKTTVEAKCSITFNKLIAKGACHSTGDFQKLAGGRDTTYYEFNFHSDAREWTGYCQQGSCKACIDGQTRCDDGSKDHNDIPEHSVSPQICREGGWVSKIGDSRQDPALNIQTRALIAIAVMISMCFLALLGVIAATCMIKKRRAAKKTGEAQSKTGPEADVVYQAPVKSGFYAPAPQGSSPKQAHVKETPDPAQDLEENPPKEAQTLVGLA